MLDPADPVTIGAMVGPEAFIEVKYLAHAKQMQALDVIPEVAAASSRSTSGDTPAAWCARYRTEDAETIVVALGSVLGTIEEVVDEMRDGGVRIGALGIKSFRPFPLEEVREALLGAPAAWWCSRRPSPSASAGSSRPTSAMALVGRASCAAAHRDRRSRRTRRSPSASLHRLLERGRSRDELEPLDLPRPRHANSSSASSSASATARRAARTPRTCCATSASVAAEVAS